MRIASIVIVYWALTPAPAQPPFPEWRGSTVRLEAAWLASPVVAVGEVVNIAPYGQQDVGLLSPPMSPSVHRLYWCQGYFRPTAVVKGDLHLPPKRYLWASGLTGCSLYADRQGGGRRFAAHVWFLREEGDFLRPTYDGGALFYIGLFDGWDGSQRTPAREQLGRLLLTPDANSDTLDDYARYFGDIVDIACELLGNKACVDQIKALSTLGNPALRDVACGFLKGQFGEGCTSRR